VSEQPAPWPPVPPGESPPASDDQKVFDTIVGPNLRLRDNLIQLAAIVAGTILGAIFGAVIAKVNDGQVPVGLILGGLAGMVISLFLSGFIIGAVRFVLAMKK
jgi:hypothetical protein